MKAFLLAAGLGTRLKPLTNTTPKCLLPVGGKSLLYWWFQLFESHGITEVLINTHYLFKQVREFLNHHRRTGKLIIFEYYEPILLGSGGTVRANRAFVENEEDFLICYADVLTNVNLSAMNRFHNTHEGVLTMALFHAANPQQYGIAETDENGRIVEFIEKPANPKSNLANAGIYIARKSIFDFFPQREAFDFGNDVLPGLIGQMYGWKTQGYLIDIGTIKAYQKAKLDWLSINS